MSRYTYVYHYTHETKSFLTLFLSISPFAHFLLILNSTFSFFCIVCCYVLPSLAPSYCPSFSTSFPSSLHLLFLIPSSFALARPLIPLHPQPHLPSGLHPPLNTWELFKVSRHLRGGGSSLSLSPHPTPSHLPPS